MTIKKMFLAALFLLTAGAVLAEDMGMKPFVLASKGPGTIEAKVSAAKASLTANGFAVVGSYSPYPSATILIVTNDELKNNAAASEHGGYGAAQRVAITKVKNDIQVSFTNPIYMANIYRMNGDLKNVYAKLEAALGKVEEFGMERTMSVTKARKYHYMFGMEYFDEKSELGEFDSYEAAIAAVESGLASGKEGVTKVYRIDIPGKKEAVFGVAMAGKPGKTKVNKDAAPGDEFGVVSTSAPEADAYIMSNIDFKEIKSTAHLPYEVLVSGNKVYSQYARFRIAINFPELSMMGKNSFMNIMECPDAIRDTLKRTINKQ
ncbi:MAG TPA: hypothetical protein VFR06_06560 [Gallionellaceae bacterium]|nr:hypothetical protein [Gallionellaceae bacterium]